VKTLAINFDFPLWLATQLGIQQSHASQELCRLVALFLYEHGQISLGKACEIGNLGYWEFAELNRYWQIPIRYTTQELAEDLEKLANV
jgi:predicted HTH domain antitoxin